jgi:hypothetical protein
MIDGNKHQVLRVKFSIHLLSPTSTAKTFWIPHQVRNDGLSVTLIVILTGCYDRLVEVQNSSDSIIQDRRPETDGKKLAI